MIMLSTAALSELVNHVFEPCEPQTFHEDRHVASLGLCPTIEGTMKVLFHPWHGGITVNFSVASTNMKTSNLRTWFVGVLRLCKDLIKNGLHVIGKR
jgi:hypothetical protein